MTPARRAGRTVWRRRPAGQTGAALPEAWPGFGLRGPRRTALASSRSLWETLSLPLGDDGVVAGRDEAGDPVVLGLFRTAQLNAVVIGSAWTAQVLALRAIDAGAEVVVESARPPVWAPFTAHAAAGGRCTAIHGVGEIPDRQPELSGPVLVVRDCGAQPPRKGPARAPWQAVLTLLPFLGPHAAGLLAEADLVGVQRVSPQEAEVLARTLRLAPEQAAALPGLDDGAMLWCTTRHRVFVRWEPKAAETGLLGEARRID